MYGWKITRAKSVCAIEHSILPVLVFICNVNVDELPSEITLAQILKSTTVGIFIATLSVLTL